MSINSFELVSKSLISVRIFTSVFPLVLPFCGLLSLYWAFLVLLVPS